MGMDICSLSGTRPLEETRRLVLQARTSLLENLRRNAAEAGGDVVERAQAAARAEAARTRGLVRAAGEHEWTA